MLLVMSNALGSLDSSVGIAMGYELDGQGSILGRARDFSLEHSVRISSGAHADSYTMVTGGCFSRGEATGA
jgi:hypothetical protein